MKNILTFLIPIIILTTSCSEEDGIGKQIDGDGVVISLPYQWKKTLHQNGVANNGHIDKAIYYKDNIGIPTTDGKDNRFLTMINTTNGETLWQWNDNYLPYSTQISISYLYQYNKLLTYQRGSKSYCINLDNGTTYWKIKREKTYDVRINPYVNGHYFSYALITNSNGHKEQIAYKGNIQTGELTVFLHANLSSDYISPVGIGGIVYINQIPNKENLLLVTYAEPLPGWEVNSFFGLYNTQTEEWVWDRKLLSPPTVNTSVFTPPQIYDGKAYANVGKKLVCHDLTTGEQVWSKQFTQDFMFSGFIIEDGLIIANNEDTYTYGLYPISGGIAWRTETSGTSGRMSYLNGIVYFVGGSSGKLHAIDVNTGKHVWKLDGYKLDGESFKTNAVYVLPAKNGEPAKVIALTHLNAYCFEAYQ